VTSQRRPNPRAADGPQAGGAPTETEAGRCLPEREPIGLELIDLRTGAYAGRAREKLVRRLRKPLGRVLDVGCGKGASADLLRAAGATELAGIEIDPTFAAAAAECYDDVRAVSVTEPMPWEPGSFDTILCHDVLEHLYDPWLAVRRLKPLLVPDGRLQLSIPNSRHKDLWLPLVLRGRFEYKRAGLLDVTHIRFFARRDAVTMLESAGLEVLRVDHDPPGSRKRALASVLTGGRAMEFLAIQWFLDSRPLPSSSR